MDLFEGSDHSGGSATFETFWEEVPDLVRPSPFNLLPENHVQHSYSDVHAVPQTVDVSKSPSHSRPERVAGSISGEHHRHTKSKADKRKAEKLPSSSESVDSGKLTDENPQAWLQKRRQQVARASKKARAKRKFEVMDLRKENKQLKDERSEFLQKIYELESKVVEMREEGTVDIQMENSLLRAQLEEHKKFLGSCLKLVNGIPKVAHIHRQMYRNGASYAMHHTLYLASRSLIETWQSATIPAPLAQIRASGVQLGKLITVCYKRTRGIGGKQVLNLRLDVVLPGVEPVTAQDLYWNTWNTSDLMSKVLDHAGVQLGSLPTGSEEPQLAEKQEIRVKYYKERGSASGGVPKDWVFLCTRQRQELAKSTLVLPLEKSPAVLSSCPSSAAPVKGKAKAPLASQVPEMGKVRCHIIARSTTEHVDQSKDVGPPQRRITGMFTEGVVVWSEKTYSDEPLDTGGSGSTSQAPGATDKLEEIQTKAPICRLAVLLSVSQDFRVDILANGLHDLIDSNGNVSYRLCSIIGNYIQQIYTESAKATPTKFM